LGAFLPISTSLTFVRFQDKQGDSAGDLVQEAEGAVDEGAAVQVLPYQRALQPNCRDLLRARERSLSETGRRLGRAAWRARRLRFTMTSALAAPMTRARGYIRLCIWLGRTKTATPEMTQSVAPTVRRDLRRRLFHLISCVAGRQFQRWVSKGKTEFCNAVQHVYNCSCLCKCWIWTCRTMDTKKLQQNMMAGICRQSQRGEEKRRAKVVILISVVGASLKSFIFPQKIESNSSSKGMKELTIAFEYSFILKSLVT
jgi:hypothetical protein